MPLSMSARYKTRVVFRGPYFMRYKNPMDVFQPHSQRIASFNRASEFRRVNLPATWIKE